MKAAQALAGKRAEQPFDLPMPDGSTAKVLLRPITQLEEAAAIGDATVFAAKRGVPNATYGDPLFDKALRAYELAIATLDPDSPVERREPFFASADEIFAHFHPDVILYLHTYWELHQDKCSPLFRAKTIQELVEATSKLAQDDERGLFFCSLSPGTRATCMRFTALHALSSPQLKSLLSSNSAPAIASG